MSKEKNPAFLLYVKDFYEGTRLLLPEERACYLDLLIYQHQNGPIPNDITRMTLYCTGCSQQTIEQVLEQKFDQTVDGWSNQRMTKEVEKLAKSQPKKDASACFAGLISTAKISAKIKNALKNRFSIEDHIYAKNGQIATKEDIKQNVRKWFNSMVDQMVDNNIENVSANVSATEKEKVSVVLPWETENFENAWSEWKSYKKEQFSFTYKPKSEKAQITELNKLTTDEQTAIEIIHQSISNGWKGLFELKENGNSKIKSNATNGTATREAFAIISQR